MLWIVDAMKFYFKLAFNEYICQVLFVHVLITTTFSIFYYVSVTNRRSAFFFFFFIIIDDKYTSHLFWGT